MPTKERSIISINQAMQVKNRFSAATEAATLATRMVNAFGISAKEAAENLRQFNALFSKSRETPPAP